jgi:hypothetical protein
MSEIGRRIDEVIQLDLAQRLRAAGFRKTARTFFCTQANHTRIVNVQASQWNHGEDGSFTINLGVYYPVVSDLAGRPRVTGKFPKEYECTVRERLGALAHDGRDHWWSVSRTTDFTHLANEVGTAWTVFGSPWLDRASTLPGAIELLRCQKLYFAAANAALALGKREDAEQLLREAMKTKPQAYTRLREWENRHGLLREEGAV